MVAYDYPLLGVFWTIIIFAVVVLLLFFIIWCFVDNFRRRDHGALAKTLWTIAILLLPFIGAIVYLLFRPSEAAA
jgi:hypothetical protein